MRWYEVHVCEQRDSSTTYNRWVDVGAKARQKEDEEEKRVEIGEVHGAPLSAVWVARLFFFAFLVG